MKGLKQQKREIMRYGMLVMGVGFIAFGAYRGEIDSVLSKAIRLCMECVGIG